MSAVATVVSGAPEQTKQAELTPLQAQQRADQLRAEQRSRLIRRGLRLIGNGITLARVSWGRGLWDYAKYETTTKARRSCLDQLMLQMIADSNGMLDERKLTSALKLYHLWTGIPSLGKLPYRFASMFEKIGKFNYESGVVAAPAMITAAEQLIQDIIAGKACCNKNGVIDRKLLAAAINAITGKKARVRKSEDTPAPDGEETGETGTVTSLQAVLAWVEASDVNDIASLCKQLTEASRLKLFDALESSVS